LKTCQFCVGAPVTCMAGVTGSDLKRRVTTIMAAPVGGHVGMTARVAFALAMAAIVAVPAINGTAAATQAATLRLPDRSKTFDAASIRPTASNMRTSSRRFGNGRLIAQGETLQDLIRYAFDLDESRLIGGPAWMNADRFDIVAKSNATIPDADLKTMAQNMLVDRFSMKMHIETRNMPVYAMVLARADGRLGPNMRPEGDGAASAGGAGGTARGVSRGGPTMTFTGTTAWLASALTSTAGRPIVDRTGLNGVYEITLSGTPAEARTNDDPAQRAPDVFEVVRDLGLKLEPTRAPIDVLVIDSAEHPVNDDFEMPAQ
jgi:uncharacterized protein (TIGR03435 family)